MSSMTDGELRYFMRFFHPDKVLQPYPGLPEMNASWLAPLYELTAAEYDEVIEGYRSQNQRAISSMMETGRVPKRLDDLPFKTGDKVVLVGDSITDDSLSWANLLTELIARLDTDKSITLVNAGVSADTTAQVVARFLAVLAEEPSWIITMIGTNDARRHGWEAPRSQQALAETKANLEYLRTLAGNRSKARLVWMTPTPVIEATMRNHWFIKQQEAWFANSDLEAIASVVRGLPGTVVDLWQEFNENMEETLYVDGLHPSSNGQQLILVALLSRLKANLEGT